MWAGILLQVKVGWKVWAGAAASSQSDRRRLADCEGVSVSVSPCILPRRELLRGGPLVFWWPWMDARMPSRNLQHHRHHHSPPRINVIITTTSQHHYHFYFSVSSVSPWSASPAPPPFFNSVTTTTHLSHSSPLLISIITTTISSPINTTVH